MTIVLKYFKMIYGIMNEKNQNQYQFAGFWVRLTAYFIDSFILLIPILLISVLAGFPLEKISFEEMPWFLTLLFVAIVWGYNIFFLTKYGTTIGKKVFRIKVIGSDGNIIGLKNAVLRETIGRILSSLFFSLGYIWVAFDSKKQAWHDKIARSYVILTQPLRGGKKLLILVIPFILFILPTIFFATKIILVILGHTFPFTSSIRPIGEVQRTTPTPTATPTLEPIAREITLYNNPSVQINHLSLGGVYMVAKTKEESIFPDWQENLEKTLQELKRFYEREFPGIDVETYVFPKVIIGDKLPGEYRNADFLPEIFSKEKLLQEWHSDPSRYKILLVYIDFIKGANEGGYGPSVEGRYTINPAFWLENRAIYGKDPYGLIGSAHELGHTLGIPHPWEMPANTQNDPNFGNVPGDIMNYSNNSLTLDQVYFSPLVKRQMGL